MNKLILALLIVVCTEGLSQQKLSNTKINDDISMKIPASFSNMTDGERIGKYVSSKTPIAMYSSEDRLVDLGINTNIMQLAEGDEEKLRSFYRGTFETLFDEIEYYQDTIQEINGRKFIVFEFLSTLKEENVFSGPSIEKNYTYIQYTSYNDQVLLFNFGCKPRKMSEWQPIAKEMMKSIKIKE